MKNLYLKLLTENIDFQSETFETKESIIKEWKLESVIVNEEEIEELFNRVLRNKGDWVDYYFLSSRGQVYVDIKLVFTKADLSNEDYLIINQSKELIESSIENLKKIEPPLLVNGIGLNNITTLNEREAELLKIRMQGHTSFKLEELLINELKDSGLDPIIESTEISIQEAGASGGEVELIVMFIAGSINSGLTYDLIKGILRSNYLFRNAEITWFKDKEFKNIRKEVAKRANINPESLVLVEFSSVEDSRYIFRSERQYIYVKSDEAKRILEYKLSRSKREVKELFDEKNI